MTGVAIVEKAKRNLAAAATVSMTVLIMAEQNRTGNWPPTKRLIAWGFVFFVLSAFADFGVEAAGAFGILVLVAIILSDGDDALAYISGQFGQATKKKGKAP